LGLSTLMVGPSTGASMYGEIGTATSAVLGDSQGSEKLAPNLTSPTKSPRGNHASAIMEEDDGHVGSVLGESYVHGEEKAVAKIEDEEELEDGGVLGLLAQIYGRKDGPVAM
jgi:autophagy-related protein 9